MPAPATSASLLQRVREMEPTAWERLTVLYGPSVYAWCRRSGVGESDAADITQEVFQAVFTQVHRFEGLRPGSFRGWLRTITTNQVRLLWRRRSTQGEGGTLARLMLEQTPDPSTRNDADGANEESDRRRILMRALGIVKQDFSDRTWTVFERTTLQSESYKEVADSLNMSANAVRQARFRVLCRLRQELSGLLP